MINKSRVSVIITARNEEKNIGVLLDALLRQTQTSKEIVINDNGSTDSTVEIIRNYQNKYDNIKLIESKGRSIGEGRNTAIRNSEGEILAIMDVGICPSDDWLEKIAAPLLINPEIDVAWGHIIFDTKSRVVPSTVLSLALVFLTKYPEHRKDGKNIPSSAFRRRVWEDMNGFPEIQLPIEDLLLIDAIEKRSYKKIYVNDAVAYYFRYPGTYYAIYKKWVVSAYSSFIVRKSAEGFYRQFFILGMFFVILGLVFIDMRMMVLALLYIILFFANKIRLNTELGRRIISSRQLLINVLKLFFVLNIARLYGVTKAIIMMITGKARRLKIIEY